jgi:TetR/AcrR family transcriptional regulator, regulator of cefoperazone and chloramphenicol sensitivity
MVEHATTPSRGEVTRESILAAAMEVFGRDGFSAASTRAIARAANTNQALIGYHFGNKQRLYLTVFEHIADRVEMVLGPTLARTEADLAPPGSGATANAALLLELVDRFAAMLLSAETATWARLILNEQQRPSEAFDILYRRVIGRVARLLTQLVARLRGRAEAAEEDRLIAITIIGQVLVFRVAHAAVLRQFSWDEIGQPQVHAILARLNANIAAILAIDLERLRS